MRLILLGPPGAGKGSLAVMLRDRWGLTHLASGDLLREAVRAKTPLGVQAEAFMTRGALVPDTLVTAMMLERLRGVPTTEGFILDGFPRTVAQAEALDQVLQAAGAPVDRAVCLETAPEMIERRLAGRRVCRSCGMNYHVRRMPPAREGICDRCGGPLEQRADDRPATIRQRLQVDAAQAAPLVAHYRQRGVLRTVNGDLDVPDLFAQLTAQFTQEGLLA